MWQAVRRELAALEWDPAPSMTQDLSSEWTQTVSSLMAIRRVLGPVPAHDPLVLLATATVGAARTHAEPVVAPSLHNVRRTLDGMTRGVEVASDDDRRRHVATLNHVAYELTHWVQVRTPDEGAKAWLLAGEAALDSAIHAPTGRSGIGVGLAAWQDALAAVQPVHNASIVRRSVTLGHLAILRNTHVLVDEAGQSGILPRSYSDAMLGNLRELARAHQTTLSQIDGRRLGATRVDQAVMLKLGTAVRHLTGRSDFTEIFHSRLDSLLRSSIGEAVLVANLTNQTAAKPVASRIRRLCLEYLANPEILRAADVSGSVPRGAPSDRPAVPVREASAPTAPGEPSITPGTILAGDTILALCRARDLGVAAATSDVAHPPHILRGVDPVGWPQAVLEGRQAVADLVASVIPMVYAKARHAFHAADVQGQMFVELMGAAYRFDPQRIGPERWPSYAWLTLEHTRQRGVDYAGTPRGRHPGPPTVTLGDTEPVSREPAPGAEIEQRQSIQAITHSIERLPHSLRDPLLESMQGRPAHSIGGDLGVSESTARRRIIQARDHVRDELALQVDAVAKVQFETVTDLMLERSERLLEETFAPSLGAGTPLGRDR